MEPVELLVDPGGQVSSTVTVRNLGTQVEEFELLMQGPGGVFGSLTPDAVSVYPDLEQRVVVRFTPPRSPESLAGVSTFEVLARSVVHSDVRDLARGRLTITPFEDLQAELRPEVSRGRKPAHHQLKVTNAGNTPVSAKVGFADQDGVLSFEPEQSSATLRPGATQDVPVLVNGPHRWFGRTERLPFSALVTPTGPQRPITLPGTRQQTAVFPWWAPPAALAIIALLIGLAALLKPGTPTVPVIGPIPEAAALQQLTNAGYIPDEIKLGDDNIAAGLATKTDPAGGTPLPHGQHVKLYISTGKCPNGPCPVEVPPVEGLPVSEAQSKLEDLKFTVRIDRMPNDERPVDRVISSTPAATTLRPSGSEVVLTVSSGPKPGPTTPAAPMQVTLLDLTGQSVDDATKTLTGLGLKAKTVLVHSNAVADGQVLSTAPAAATKVDPGSEVTLTIARNTASADLIATADQAAWTSEAGKLTFPGKAGSTAPFALVRSATLPDGSTAQVLETHPAANGFVTGVYQLATPAVAGDHVRARVGLLEGTGSASGQVTFQVKANGKVIKQVTGSVGQLTDLDADLSAAKGATSIEITVLAGASPVTGSPVWQDLRLEPQIS
ncbi:MAG: PASTA domain-containing protein [Pseudonocardiaceae bacterium]